MGVVAEGKGVRIDAEIPAHLSVLADKDMIELVVRNLLSNAVKFSPKGKLVRIRAKREGEDIILGVADQGTGMSEAQQAVIFTSEVKPATGTNSEKGMGLGLLMCKEFIEAQSGTISFESRQGEGTTFQVRLPAA